MIPVYQSRETRQKEERISEQDINVISQKARIAAQPDIGAVINGEQARRSKANKTLDWHLKSC